VSDDYILAIDQGTTNTKALLVDRTGQPVFRASIPLRIASPREGWVEQDPLEIWSSVQSVAEQCMKRIAKNELRGIGISNQRETVVIWERATGKPLAPAIVWQCRRSADICCVLQRQGREAFLRGRTGLGIDPLFSGSKLCWLLENVPGLRERAENGEVCAGTIDSWLIWNLTGGKVHACDLSNAARTQLLNIGTCEWDDEVLGLFGVPRGILPALAPSGSVFGITVGLNSLSDGVPIASAIGDSHAALFGHGSQEPGTLKATYGTGTSLMMLVASPKLDCERLASTIAWSVPGATQYALEGNITMTGSAIQWVGEFLQRPDPINDAVSLSESGADSGGVYFVPGMVGLGAPYWDSAVRGAIFGLTRTSTAAHLARAAVEAIAFQVRDVFEAMREESRHPIRVLRADGGGSRDNRLMQFQADMLGCPVERSSFPDLSALGAAWLAGVTLDFWKSTDDLVQPTGAADTFRPQLDEKHREKRYEGWLRSVARARYEGTSAC
jgi:glycerol kinase